MQREKYKEQKGKQRYTDMQNTTQTNKALATRTPLNTVYEIMCCQEVNIFCSTSETRRGILVNATLISHDR